MRWDCLPAGLPAEGMAGRPRPATGLAMTIKTPPAITNMTTKSKKYLILNKKLEYHVFMPFWLLTAFSIYAILQNHATELAQRLSPELQSVNLENNTDSLRSGR
ncbi:MAG: hypothetical protein AAB817_02765 [Patescibacteria group bacterium]